VLQTRLPQLFRWLLTVSAILAALGAPGIARAHESAPALHANIAGATQQTNVPVKVGPLTGYLRYKLVDNRVKITLKLTGKVPKGTNARLTFTMNVWSRAPDGSQEQRLSADLSRSYKASKKIYVFKSYSASVDPDPSSDWWVQYDISYSDKNGGRNQAEG
jgi:hypothetical protein